MTCDGCANATKRILGKMEGEVAPRVTLGRLAVWNRSHHPSCNLLVYFLLCLVPGIVGPEKKRKRKEVLEWWRVQHPHVVSGLACRKKSEVDGNSEENRFATTIHKTPVFRSCAKLRIQVHREGEITHLSRLTRGTIRYPWERKNSNVVTQTIRIVAYRTLKISKYQQIFTPPFSAGSIRFHPLRSLGMADPSSFTTS